MPRQATSEPAEALLGPQAHVPEQATSEPAEARLGPVAAAALASVLGNAEVAVETMVQMGAKRKPPKPDSSTRWPRPTPATGTEATANP